MSVPAGRASRRARSRARPERDGAGTVPGTQLVRAADVAAIWRREVAGNPLLIAAVKTDPAAEYRRMVAVLDGLQSAGAERISLQVLER